MTRDRIGVGDYASRPLVTRSRAELERAVLAAVRALCIDANDANKRRLRDASNDLAEWEKLRGSPDNLVLLCAGCHRFVHSPKNITREFIREEVNKKWL